MQSSQHSLIDGGRPGKDVIAGAIAGLSCTESQHILVDMRSLVEEEDSHGCRLSSHRIPLRLMAASVFCAVAFDTVSCDVGPARDGLRELGFLTFFGTVEKFLVGMQNQKGRSRLNGRLGPNFGRLEGQNLLDSPSEVTRELQYPLSFLCR